MTGRSEERSVPEQALLTQLRRVLGKNLNQSDIDFLHVLVHPDVIRFTSAYLDYKVLELIYQPMVFTCIEHNKPTIRLLNSREFYHEPYTGEVCSSTTFVRGLTAIPRVDAVAMEDWARDGAGRERFDLDQDF